MLQYCRENDCVLNACDDKLFFDVKFTKDSCSVHNLSFGTRHRGICTRITITSSTCLDPSIAYKFCSSLGLESLNKEGNLLLVSGKSAACFISSFVWAEMSKLLFN
uniref:Uncharacterized protein n=1 Tax=Ciona intestinalis TaxID=7719 RepID=H2XM14_CIOIN